jgi:hypothetical protein
MKSLLLARLLRTLVSPKPLRGVIVWTAYCLVGAYSGADNIVSRRQAGRPAEERSAMASAQGKGTKEDPWRLKTPPGTSGYTMYLDEAADPPAIVCQVGGTQLRYHRRAIEDLHAMLNAHGDWMLLGGADEQKEAQAGTVEAWGRASDNPVGGWYGLKKGLRGRFGVYMPPLLEALGLAELTHDAKNNRMRAI